MLLEFGVNVGQVLVFYEWLFHLDFLMRVAALRLVSSLLLTPQKRLGFGVVAVDKAGEFVPEGLKLVLERVLELVLVLGDLLEVVFELGVELVECFAEFLDVVDVLVDVDGVHGYIFVLDGFRK